MTRATMLRRAVALIWGVALAGALVPTAARAQDAALRKGDIVRFLSGTTYSQQEIATLVSNNCLSFEPTERDIRDFQALGASQGVIAAVRRCAGEQESQPAAQPAPAPTAQAGVEVEPVLDTVRAVVNSTALVTVLVRRAGQPFGGAEIVLEGSGSLPGGADADRSSTSGSDGRAGIEVPTGRRVGTYPLTIGSTSGPVRGRSDVVLVVTAGPPAVLASPGSSVPYDGGDLVVPLRVEDDFGNPAAGRAIAVAGGSEGRVLARTSTDADGRSEIMIPEASMQGVRRLVVSSGGTTVGEIEISSDASAVTMAFVAGGSQTGTPGRAFDDPVVVEAYDAAGDPAVDVEVRFEVQNGSLDRSVVRTGADGRAAVGVTAGEDASRPVEVRAASGEAEARVNLPVLARERLVEESVALGARRLSSGDAEGAGVAFRRAIELDSEKLDAWLGLGDAYTALGRAEDARFAYEQALAIDPGNEAATTGLASPVLGRTVLVLDAWGGKTDNGGDAGLQYVEVQILPAIDWLGLRGTFDDALNLRTPWLKRGADDLRGFSGAASLKWGGGLTTTFELGRREQPTNDITQNTLMAAQDLRLPGGGGFMVGVWLGRWFDRDDYVVFGEARFPASRYVTVVPSISYADEAGSNVLTSDGLIATGRAPETEIRGGLTLQVQSGAGWGIEPGFAVGSVTSDLSDEFSGTLTDVSGLAWVRLGQVRIQGFARYQTPPGTPAFWTVALGFGLDVRAR